MVAFSSAIYIAYIFSLCFEGRIPRFLATRCIFSSLSIPPKRPYKNVVICEKKYLM